MATGKLPFEGQTQGSVFDSILNRAPIPPVQLNGALPAELERIIVKCLQKEREQVTSMPLRSAPIWSG